MAVPRRKQQSIYDKTLTIFQEGSKTLRLISTELERERIQATINHSMERNRVRSDLLNLTKERKRLAREPWQAQMETLRRQRSFTEISDTKERRKLLKSYLIERDYDIFPDITCTQANVPKILKRSISAKSEFHNWVTGLPSIRGNNSSAGVQLSKENSASKKESAPPKENKRNQDQGGERERRLIKRSSTVDNISYSIPVSLKRELRVLDRQVTERSIKALLNKKPDCTSTDKATYSGYL